jgi:hypothetical protein
MFWMERHNYHFVLSPAFKLYDALLKHYFRNLLTWPSDREKMAGYSMLCEARSYIQVTQQERGKYFDQMQKELSLWDEARMLQELNEQGDRLQGLANGFFREEEIFDSDWVTDQHSIAYIISFLEPIRDEERYIIGWIKELVLRLGDACRKDHAAFWLRTTLEPSISKITSQEGLLEAWEARKKEYPDELEQVWLEVMFSQAIKRLEGNNYRQFWEIWS